MVYIADGGMDGVQWGGGRFRLNITRKPKDLLYKQYFQNPINKKTHKTKEKSISLEDTVMYKEIHKRNLRLLITAIVMSCIGIVSLIPVIFERDSFFMVVAGIFIAISIYQFVLIYRRKENMFNHPDMKQFLKWGEKYGDYAIAMNNELKENKKIEFSNAFFTNNFVFIPSFYRFRWFHFSEVCWAFNHVTQHSVNFIPTRKTYKVHVYLDDKSLVKIQSDSSGEILNHLIKTAPFAYYGYSYQIKEAWSKDNVNFINNVKYRMNQFLTNPHKFIKENFE